MLTDYRTVAVLLKAQINGYIDPLKRATRTTREFRDEVSKAAKEGKLDQLAGTAAIAGAAITGAFGLVVAAGAKYEQAMSAVKAATGESADAIDKLSKAALKAGADTQYSATEAANGITELAKAGVSTSDILGGGLTGALSLAAAGQIGVAEAAETAASALTQFRLKGAQVGHVADLLAAGAGKAQGGVGDLAQALNQTGLVASQTGLSIEETIGTLTAFAKAGLVGSDSGTSFRTMLLRLAAPSGEAARLMERLGISAFDAQGNFIGMAKFAGVLRQALQAMSQEEKQAAFATIFGQDAIRAASITYDWGAEGIRTWIDAVNDSGFAQRQAADLTDNLMGDVERLTGSLETLFITSESGANGGLRVLVRTFEGLVDAVGAMPGPVQSTVLVIGGLSGAGLLAFAAFVKAKGSLQKLNAELAATGPLGARAANTLGRVGAAATRAGGVIAAVAITTSVLGAIFGKDLNPQVDALAEGLERLAKGAGASGELARLLGADMSKLDAGLRNATSSGKGFALWVESTLHTGEIFDNTWTKNVARIEAVDSALALLVNSGRANEAARAFAAIRERAAGMGISMDQLRRIFPEYFAAVEVANADNAKLENSTEAVTRAQLGAVKAGEKLIDIWNQLHGAQKSADEEMLDAIEALENVKKSFQENGKAIEGNSKAALLNRIALQEFAKEAYEAADALINNGGSAEQAKAKIEEFKNALTVLLTPLTGSAAKAKELADELFRIPTVVNTTVKVKYEWNGSSWVDQATGRKMAGPHPNPTTGKWERWGGIAEHAATGRLRDAEIYPAGSSPLYAFAEPETGGEAFVPKRGNYSRSMAILSQAARWYGAAVIPDGARNAWYGTPTGATGATASATSNGSTLVYAQFGAETIEARAIRVQRESNWRQHVGTKH